VLQEAVAHGLPLGQQPCTKSRIDRVELLQQVLKRVFDLEQPGMHPATSRRLKYLGKVDVQARAIEGNGELVGLQALDTCGLEDQTKLAQRLAQRGARVTLVDLAPEQADQALRVAVCASETAR
jgi:2-polyprenyl-3-methyl-5-hydroxy-6-metoxy-1,4-benzoquinol methylase